MGAPFRSINQAPLSNEPPSKLLEINRPPVGLNRGFTVEAEVHAEVVDQSTSLIRTLQEPGDIQPSDIMAFDKLTCKRIYK